MVFYIVFWVIFLVQSIKSFMNHTDVERYGQEMSKEKTTNIFSFIVAVFALGGGLGGLGAGWWADFWGRSV